MIIVKAPFRISLFGGSTDYKGFYEQYGSFMIGTPIDKYCYISMRYRPEILSNLLDRQDRIFKKNIERQKKGKEIIDPRVFLVMDDLQSKKDEWVNDPSFVSIMCEGRHRAITLILVSLTQPSVETLKFRASIDTKI
jgi:hypothetical protein